MKAKCNLIIIIIIYIAWNLEESINYMIEDSGIPYCSEGKILSTKSHRTKRSQKD